MTCIIFKLRHEIPRAKQNALLEEIKYWHRENRLGRVHFDSNDSEELLLCYVYVIDRAVAENTLKRLQQTSEVEYAHIPPARFPVTVGP